jgi:hypothetical protein
MMRNKDIADAIPVSESHSAIGRFSGNRFGDGEALIEAPGYRRF